MKHITNIIGNLDMHKYRGKSALTNHIYTDLPGAVAFALQFM
jgi:hypothetical protein